MITLSIDTSSNAASLGLFKKSNNSQEKIYLKSWEKKRSHSEVITNYLTAALTENNLTTKDIKLICLGIGPGSFTGIRVALNFAKALSYSHDIPIYTVNSLAPIAYNNQNLHSQILVLNNAFRNMVYGAGFTTGPFKEVTGPFACEPEKISEHISNFNLNEKILILGNAFDLYKKLFSKSDLDNFIIHPESQSKICAYSVFKTFLHDEGPALKKWSEVVPLYIRGSEAEEKLKLQLMK